MLALMAFFALTTRVQAQTGPLSLDITPANQTLGIGATHQYAACTRYLGGVRKNVCSKTVTNSAKWSSSNPAVATVGIHGLVTAKATGTTEIIASSGPAHNKIPLSVFTAVCGDGVRQTGEQCDDGNTTNLDACSSTCQFEDDLYVNSLTMQFGTSSTSGGSCPKNALGGSIPNGTVQTEIQNNISANVLNLGMLLTMNGLSDPEGNQSPQQFQLGALQGSTPVGQCVAGTPSPTNTTDGWTSAFPAYLDAKRVPLVKLNATYTGGFGNGTISAGPGGFVLPLNIGGPTVALRIANATVKGQIATLPIANGCTYIPGVSGHAPSENLAPTIGNAFAGLQGNLCGDFNAAPLAAVTIPSVLAGAACNQNYPATASFLDVMVGGCTFIVLPLVTPTQPDGFDASAPVAGAGGPYTLLEDANHHVSSCHDKGGATVDLNTCLNAATYSAFFTFNTQRVIIKP